MSTVRFPLVHIFQASGVGRQARILKPNDSNNNDDDDYNNLLLCICATWNDIF